MTQVIDPTDPVLGFTIRLIRALHQRAGNLVVIANEVREVPPDLDVEVVSLGKELGRGRLAKALRYQRVLGDVCRRQRPAILLAHMCPTYLTVGAPMVRVCGGRSMLWFTHQTSSPKLGRAERLADVVFTALPGSYPRTSAKVRAIGHSIDTDQFRPLPARGREGPLLLVALGRTSAMKRYPVVVRAVQQARDAGVDVRLRILGASSSPAEQAHRRELETLVSSLGVGDAVTLEHSVDHEAIPGVLAEAHGLVNAHSTGSADKVVFEAMACGRPPLVSSEVFTDLLSDLGLRLQFREGDADDLAARIVDLAGRSQGELNQLGALLRQRVERHHSLNHWADEVVRVAAALHADGATPSPAPAP